MRAMEHNLYGNGQKGEVQKIRDLVDRVSERIGSLETKLVRVSLILGAIVGVSQVLLTAAVWALVDKVIGG